MLVPGQGPKKLWTWTGDRSQGITVLKIKLKRRLQHILLVHWEQQHINVPHHPHAQVIQFQA